MCSFVERVPIILLPMVGYVQKSNLGVYEMGLYKVVLTSCFSTQGLGINSIDSIDRVDSVNQTSKHSNDPNNDRHMKCTDFFGLTVCTNYKAQPSETTLHTKHMTI